MSTSMQTYTAAQVLGSTAIFKELRRLLDLSFANDPLPNYLLKKHSGKEYLKYLTYYHHFMLRAALLSGAIAVVISDDTSTKSLTNSTHLASQSSMKSLAILIPPSGNTSFDSGFTHIRAGILSYAWHAGFGAFSSFLFDFVPKLEAMVASMYPAPNEHKKHDQWHLLFLGTRPDCQGQGLGRKLLLECQRVVTDAASENTRLSKAIGPLYLEASTLDSKRLYTRMGFVDRGEMVYGECREGEAVAAGRDGKIVGARIFAMTWMP